jgi:hypothetical protein
MTQHVEVRQSFPSYPTIRQHQPVKCTSDEECVAPCASRRRSDPVVEWINFEISTIVTISKHHS